MNNNDSNFELKKIHFQITKVEADPKEKIQKLSYERILKGIQQNSLNYLNEINLKVDLFHFLQILKVNINKKKIL